MSILKVARLGHPVLRQQARPVPPEEMGAPPLQRLVDDMIETMLDYEGIGLAAPQVFRSLRLIVLGTPGAEGDDAMPLTALFNPELTPLAEGESSGWEGCLSIPELRGVVPRAAGVEVRAFDRDGRRVEFVARDYLARVLQHEVDHLDGVLFVDRMSDLQTLTYLEEYRRYWLRAEED